MKIQLIILSIGILALTACKKDEDPSLSGSASTSGFSYEVKRLPGGDTLPFANTVVFANQSMEAFTYLWDFGDANQSVLKNPVHKYDAGTSFLVKLTSVGTAGNNTSSKTIGLDSPCDYEPFSVLTSCGNAKWSMSPVSDAIRILSADGATEEFTGPAANCQADDVYTFSVSGALNYDSKGKTFVANEGPNPYSCQNPVENAPRFFMIKGGTGNPRLVLDAGDSLSRLPFLGTTDPVQGNSYEILSLTSDAFVVQGILLDGKRIQMKFASAGLSANSIRLFLTGGSSKTWRLDSTSNANSIVAGTEANPTLYYAGGALAPCQKDDWYTFTNTDSVTVKCNGSTLQPTQGYTCGNDESFKTKFTYGPVTGGVAGAAQIGLTPNLPSQWIGILDRSPENVYRILEISNSTMLLRSGNGTGNVHTMKFVVK